MSFEFYEATTVYKTVLVLEIVAIGVNNDANKERKEPLSTSVIV